MQRFIVTEQHIKLLRAANVGWGDCEFGAPAIDCKRPYGNSDVYGDIADILGLVADDDGSYGALHAEMNQLHKETKTALQIFLATGTMETGEYIAPQYTREWRKV